MYEIAPINMIKPNPWNVNYMTDEELTRLCALLRVAGQEKTPPLIVRRRGDYYEIVDGEQRWKAAQRLGWSSLPILVVEMSDYDVKKYSISYNHMRGRLNYAKLLDLMLSDEDFVKIVEEEDILGAEDKKHMKTAFERARKNEVSQEAKKMLEESILRDGIRFQPAHLAIFSEPKEHQVQALNIILAAHDAKMVMDSASKQFEPLPPPAIKDEVNEETREVREIVQAAEVAVKFKCECGQAYAAYYNAEKKEVKVDKIDLKKLGTERYAYEYVTQDDEPLQWMFQCPKCHVTIIINAESGEVELANESWKDRAADPPLYKRG